MADIKHILIDTLSSPAGTARGAHSITTPTACGMRGGAGPRLPTYAHNKGRVVLMRASSMLKHASTHAEAAQPCTAAAPFGQTNMSTERRHRDDAVPRSLAEAITPQKDS